MLFQQLIFTLELIFFVVLLIYACFVRRESNLREKLYLSLPAVIAVMLLSSGLHGYILGCADPVVDILSSLLLMILLFSYSSYGYKYLSVLSYLLVFISAVVITFRFAGMPFGFCSEVHITLVVYPMIIGVIMFLLVLFSRDARLDAKAGKSIRSFKADEIFSYIFSISAFFCILILYMSVSIMPVGIMKTAFCTLAIVLALGLYYLHFNKYIRCFTNVRGSHSSASVPHPQLICVENQSGDNDAVKEMYGRILDLFDTDKPYLVDGITISEVARRLFTNKVYVSRAINDYTGKNFCQFVNYYRVMYAVQLFNDNPYLKVSDLSDMSGFHNQVSFNMAFRLIMNDTPSDWCRRMRLERER